MTQTGSGRGKLATFLTPEQIALLGMERFATRLAGPL
eukprot:CAMPEP_0197668934 /NCGR_PEP_ID=MMETSP1338-20131121/70626_1 /TAXON_ID=43686 ORGANISM="Pelagodinium beii, Strain RCC1491" /NCGR_SAMPLE_ID=MMETSP1338 /ASSEMBLY_ACC=CAM_ASM_000754 /LENGTH=36 /DNA_ID= /DNA_START= /DNA_END= /DNA_ORIENTATION=